jgi:hypothetical protein
MSMQISSITKAFQWDLARQVERLDFLLELLPRYAEWGFQELYVHLEDAVEYPSLPGVARTDAYSYRKFARLVDAATKVGIGVVPIVNLLGHTQYLIKTPELRDLNELRDDAGDPLVRGQICPLHPRTLEIAGKRPRDMAPFCTTGKVHVGLDESFHLGKCPRCQTDAERRGLAAHFAGYAGELHRLAAGLGLRMGLWADMLALLPAVIPLLPRDVIAYDWYYYPFDRHPRVELRNFAEVDLAAPLKSRGIEYWGCPMNGAFRFEPLPVFGDRLANIVSWWKRCNRVGAGGFLVTSWEVNRLAIELTTVVDAAAACLWLNPEIEQPQEMLARGFARMFSGKPIGSRRAAARRQATVAAQRLNNKPFNLTEARRFARAALAGDEYAFAGYHRWQINDRWDVCAGRDGTAKYECEERKLTEICRRLSVPTKITKLPQADLANRRDGRGRPGRPSSCPPALAASLAFRLYLAKRDVFVRRAAEGVFQLRREIARNSALAHKIQLRDRVGSPLAGDRFLANLLRPAYGGQVATTCPPELQRRWKVASYNLHRSDLAIVRSLLVRLQREAAAFSAALRAGRAAARAMWRLSRNPRVCGPNELMLERDAERLRGWRRWLSATVRNPDLAWQASPVCGAWQLLFTVHNFAPAVQKVVVEQQQPDKKWATLHELYAIEFRAFAARPRTKIRREFSIPIAVAAQSSPTNEGGKTTATWSERAKTLKAEKPKPKEGFAVLRFPDFPISFGHLRLAVRGAGLVAIDHVELTNGVVIRRPSNLAPRRKVMLGRPAGHVRFPDLNWTTNQGSKQLTLA